ncbi:uncharacterized protein LOC128264288 [Drosophila gunungcola]|uniref:Uncharacterized protein n=1 Tax=Drosophila gunungcola TaxID=103775 RepID=A0A9P9YD64_9MUSC|nr:uncharacterized protein LOC128264288 [Drosophila gunungcola]KAI8034633.1 hypothetical protein M5D96_012595 [Drosophila gunungcola]
MQRSIFKSGVSRALVLFSPLKSLHQKVFFVDEILAAAPELKSRCLDLLGRLMNGRLNLLGGRPVPPRFLPMLVGDQDRSVHFNAEEDEEFRQRLGRQLKELREALQETQENREEDVQHKEDEEHPYTTATGVEDLTDEELDEMRTVRMSSGQDSEGRSGNTEQPETAAEMETEEATEGRQPGAQESEEVVDVYDRMRDGEIEGVYWTGEGKRIVTQAPQRKTGHSGFIDGDGEEVLEEESSPGKAAPYHPPSPRAHATSKLLRKGRKPRTSPKPANNSDSDE